MADISITPANVQASANAIIKSGPVAAATTIAQGQTVYITAANTLGLADSDGTTPAFVVAGIALSAGSPGQRINYVESDPSFTFGGTVLAGDVILQSDTPGGVTKTVGELEAGDVVTVLGVALTTTTMNLKPVQGGAI